MHFGENQLSRSLIGLSPLPTPHPPGFQPWWVRASTESYPRFTLDMGRSPRFGSTACDSNALFRLAFAQHTVSGTLSQPLTGALFTFPSRYSSTIGHQDVFRLSRWSCQIHTGFPEPRATRERTQHPAHGFHLQDSHPLRCRFPPASAIRNGSAPGRQTQTGTPHNPTRATPAEYHTRMV